MQAAGTQRLRVCWQHMQHHMQYIMRILPPQKRSGCLLAKSAAAAAYMWRTGRTCHAHKFHCSTCGAGTRNIERESAKTSDKI